MPLVLKFWQPAWEKGLVKAHELERKEELNKFFWDGTVFSEINIISTLKKTTLWKIKEGSRYQGKLYIEKGELQWMNLDLDR